MKWFFRWVMHGLRTLDKDDREADTGYATPVSAGVVAPRRRNFNNLKIGLANKTADDEQRVNLNQSAMTFRLYPANGGHIVEYSYYNDKTDAHDQALHLIASDQDLGEAISKIMTLEALKR